MPKGFEWKPDRVPGSEPDDGEHQISDNERNRFAEIEAQLADDPAIPAGPGQGHDATQPTDDAGLAIDHTGEQYLGPPDEERP